ncbi:hypothetical protein JYT44_03020, partial [Caldithrix abyssi]|nr:hypothetical protein [Caldithrix abyssi]
MKLPFRKNNRAFSEKIFKKAEQQKSTIGSEHIKEYLIDGKGYEYLIKNEFSKLLNQNGLPVTIREKISLLADCNCRVNSPEELRGRCKNNHLICINCGLYVCGNCGEKICDKDMLELKSG